MEEYYGNNDWRDYLAHYGVKGMKWHHRKHQYQDRDKNSFSTWQPKNTKKTYRVDNKTPYTIKWDEKAQDFKIAYKKNRPLWDGITAKDRKKAYKKGKRKAILARIKSVFTDKKKLNSFYEELRKIQAPRA